METVVAKADNRRAAWIIVSDDNCPVVRFLSRLVRSYDKRACFDFIGRETSDDHSKNLFRELAASPWSLMLIDDLGERHFGPEAIPYILKNLPSGRLACVAYLIPGTMLLTRQLYACVSRNRNKIATLKVPACKSEKGQNAA